MRFTNGDEARQQVLETSEEFVSSWWRGVASGADAAAGVLSELVSDDVQFMPDGVVQHAPTKVRGA